MMVMEKHSTFLEKLSAAVAGRRVAVVGLGRTGMAAARLLKGPGPSW